MTLNILHESIDTAYYGGLAIGVVIGMAIVLIALWILGGDTG